MVRGVWRWSIGAATGASLVLCLTASALWARSNWWWDEAGYVSDVRYVPPIPPPRKRSGGAPAYYVARYVHVRSGSSLVEVGSANRTSLVTQMPSPGPYGETRRTWYSFSYSGPQFGFSVETTDSVPRGVIVAVHYGWIVAATALLPLVAFVKWRRRRRLPRRGADGSLPCPTCEYDLRATPDRCPEC
ncbi:MAG TPA: hypothetical protein VK986_22660, partial [Tepidisphaeraceae bacterium]|nr:hypothetical protein [Tepidisphaeraceae bacterium]